MPKKKKSWKDWFKGRTHAFWVVMGLVIGALVVPTIAVAILYRHGVVHFVPTPTDLTAAQFIRAVDRGEVEEVKITPDREGIQCRYDIRFRDGRTFLARGMYQSCGDLSDQLAKDTRLRAVFLPSESSASVDGTESATKLIASLIEWGFILGMLYLILGRIFSGLPGPSKGEDEKEAEKPQPFVPSTEARVTFADVGGIDEAREDLEELVRHLKDPVRLLKLGGRPLRGCLLVGPPGTGKTFLARAVAGEAGVPFFSIAGSSLSRSLVGQSAGAIRSLFEAARAVAPAIIFIDEIDAIGRSRTKRDPPNWDLPGLNQLLVEMDGIGGGEGVVVIAATNHPELLDAALTRPGRFDRKISLPLADAKGRQAILAATVRSRKIALAASISLEGLARSTPGFSGADLANLLNEAVLSAVRADRTEVTEQDLDLARDRVLMGSATARVLTARELRVVAVHEAGHAIVAYHLPNTEPIHKITIVNRGEALGMVTQVPEEDRYLSTRVELIASIAVMLGGRLAEERASADSHVTTGASGDFRQATDLAVRMVREWGMARNGQGAWSRYRTYTVDDDLSGSLQEQVETEVAAIIEEARQLASETLKTHDGRHALLVAALLERETLTREDLDRLFAESVETSPAPTEA